MKAPGTVPGAFIHYNPPNPMPPVQVTRTYLEMSSPGALRQAVVPAPAPRLERV